MIADDLDTLDPHQLRDALRAARAEAAFKQVVIDKLTHENAILKRLKFAAQSERFSAEQKSLLDETLDSDLVAVAAEIEALHPGRAAGERQQPRREKLPAHLPRRDVHHEPENTACGCGQAMQRIGEDVAEKLDYQPGVFTVERHIRGKWVCKCCERIVQAPVAPHIIDKGLPTTGLLAQVLVAKYLDHLPLYRQEAIFERAGHAIARSTLAQWVGECGVQLQPLVDALAAELLRQPVLHADETPVAMLKPGNGKTHLAAAILQAVLTPEVRYTTALDLVRAVRDTWRRDSDRSELQLLSYLERLDLLVIDEIGMQYGTDGEQTILFDVLDRRLADNEYVAGANYSIADIAIWPWYGGVALGRNYPGAAEFLATDEYEHVLRWAKQIDARPAVKRGRIVNKLSGDESEQLHERHHASDFELRTQDKLQPTDEAEAVKDDAI